MSQVRLYTPQPISTFSSRDWARVAGYRLMGSFVSPFNFQFDGVAPRLLKSTKLRERFRCLQSNSIVSFTLHPTWQSIFEASFSLNGSAIPHLEQVRRARDWLSGNFYSLSLSSLPFISVQRAQFNLFSFSLSQGNPRWKCPFLTSDYRILWLCMGMDEQQIK